MSLYVASWDAPPGVDLDDLKPGAARELADMLAQAGVEARERIVWTRFDDLITAHAPVGPDRGTRPWEAREAWMDDMMPDPWTEAQRTTTGTGWPT